MKIYEISFLGLLAPIWLAPGLQLVLFLQPGSPESCKMKDLASPGPPIGAVSAAWQPPGTIWQHPA